MTTDRIALQQLLEKGSDADLLREMIAFVADRLMTLEVESLCGAAYGERTAARTTHRNGFRDRPWETRAGTVELKIPKLRKGCHLPGFLEPRRIAVKGYAAPDTGQLSSERGLCAIVRATPTNWSGRPPGSACSISCARRSAPRNACQKTSCASPMMPSSTGQGSRATT